MKTKLALFVLSLSFSFVILTSCVGISSNNSLDEDTMKVIQGMIKEDVEEARKEIQEYMENNK